MATAIAEYIEIQVDNAHDIEGRLNSAVQDLQVVAARTRTHGILVTRLSPGHFRVSLSDQVPFGLTRELIH
jgi:hypothetical protein